MSFSTNRLNPAEDWDLFDGRDDADPVYYPYDVSTDTYGAGFPVPALFRALSLRPMNTSEAVTHVAQTIVHVPTASFTDRREPRFNDRIELVDENGTPLEVWYVKEIDMQTFSTRARFICTRGIE